MQLESLVYAITLCVYVHAGLGIRSACLWACVVRLSAGLHIFFAGGVTFHYNQCDTGTIKRTWRASTVMVCGGGTASDLNSALVDTPIL